MRAMQASPGLLQDPIAPPTDTDQQQKRQRRNGIRWPAAAAAGVSAKPQLLLQPSSRPASMLPSRQAEQHQQPSGGLTSLQLGRQAEQHDQQSSHLVARHSLASLDGQAAGQDVMRDARQARAGRTAPAALQRRILPAQAAENDGVDSQSLLSHGLLPVHPPSCQHTAPLALALQGSHVSSPPLPRNNTALQPALPFANAVEPAALSCGPDGAGQDSLGTRAAAAVATQTQESCLKVQAAARDALDVWGEAAEDALGDGAQAAQSAVGGGAAVNSGPAGSPVRGDSGQRLIEGDVPAPQSRSSAGISPQAKAPLLPQGYGCVPETPTAASGHDELPSKGHYRSDSRVPAKSWRPSAADSQGRAAQPMNAQEEGLSSSRVAAGSHSQAAQAGVELEEAPSSWVPGGNLQDCAGGQHGQAEQAKTAQADRQHSEMSLAGRQPHAVAAQGEWPGSDIPAGTWQASAGRSLIQAAGGRAATEQDVSSQVAPPYVLSPLAEPGQVSAHDQSAALAEPQCLAAELVQIAGGKQQRLAGSPVQRVDGSRLLQLGSRQLCFQDPVQVFSMSLDTRCVEH